MMSNNGLMTYKNISLSFINKGIAFLSFIFLMLIIVPCSCFMFFYWSEIPMLMKIGCIILLPIILFGILITPFNGMFISKRGNVIFIPDLRIKKVNMNNLERIAINFNEWENYKYTATVKLVYKDGRVFVKDYSNQFRIISNNIYKKLCMSMYTIRKSKVDEICEKMLNIDICVITVINEQSNIVYQNKNF